MECVHCALGKFARLQSAVVKVHCRSVRDDDDVVCIRCMGSIESHTQCKYIVVEENLLISQYTWLNDFYSSQDMFHLQIFG